MFSQDADRKRICHEIIWLKHKKPSQQSYAVVTGAGSGIGRSFALELARRGGTVVCSDINLEAAQATVSLIEQLGATAFSVQCDVQLQS